MSNIPVLLLIFNRPHYLKKNIINLRKIKPKKIFVFCDGPRTREDIELCKDSINLLNKINWECKVEKKFLKKNLGCKEAVSKAISWFFKKNSEGIILEDDCIPNKSFFKFCELLLPLYKKNPQIGCITGDNFLSKEFKFKDQYYLSKYANCWGWATWKSKWKVYRKDIRFWPKLKKSNNWKTNFLSSEERKYWSIIFDACYEKKIDSWAYPWTLSLWKKRMLTITPKKNLVENIGLLSSRKKIIFKKKTYKSNNISLNNFRINNKLKINQIADNYVFKKHFKGNKKLIFWKFLKLFKRNVI